MSAGGDGGALEAAASGSPSGAGVFGGPLRAAVFGGYGTFGRQVAWALAEAGMALCIAGRDGGRAAAFAAALGGGHAGVAADAGDAAACARALVGVRVAVGCAGPFASLPLALPEACLAAGVHYVDIADDRAWWARLRALAPRFRERGLAAIPGCSSLPGISGALALRAAARLGTAERARVTLFIGNDNPRGGAAVGAAAAQLGRPFVDAAGTARRGFRGREVVALPSPFGRRAALDFESPDLDLLPALVGARDVRVKVGFESRLATAAWSALAHLGPRAAPPLARALGRLGRPWRAGSSGGAVQVELQSAGGRRAVAWAAADRDGQRMAALPAAWVAAGLATGAIEARGLATAYETLGAEALLSRLAAAGYDVGESLGR